MRSHPTKRTFVCKRCGKAFQMKRGTGNKSERKYCSRACYVYPSDKEKFWSKVNKTDTCWIWTEKSRLTYGRFRQIGGKFVSAHRYSWEMHFGAIPDGLWVLHHCDNPRCVRPEHLYVGTALDNARDRVVRGRSNFRPHGQPGEKNGNALLTERQVRAIRQAHKLYRVGSLLLSDLTKVSVTKIKQILQGKAWKHLLE